MHLKTVSSGGRKYLYLVEPYKENGKTKHRYLERLARLDQLPEAEQERCWAVARQRMALWKQERDALASTRAIAALNAFQQRLEQLQHESNDHASYRISTIHYGHYAVKRLWDDVLGLTGILCSLQSRKTRATSYRLNHVAWMSVASRMMQPSSYLSLYERKFDFIANPLSALSLQHIYHGLGLLGKFSDEIMHAAVRNLTRNLQLGKPTMVYFDCTNFYFETRLDSREAFVQRRRREHYHLLIEKGMSPQDAMASVDVGDAHTVIMAEADEAEDAGEFMRMRGPSKEGRFAQPITGLALVINEYGMPLDFMLYPGNESEQKFLCKVASRMKAKHGVTHCVYVADRGLNSAENIAALRNMGLGFVVAQKVRSLTKEQIGWLTDRADWPYFEPQNAILAADLDDDIDGQRMQYKEVSTTKKVRRVDANTGKRVYESIDCKMVITFSKTRRRRDLHEINKMVAEATQAVSDKTVVGPCCGKWRLYVETEVDVFRDEQRAAEKAAKRAKKLAGDAQDDSAKDANTQHDTSEQGSSTGAETRCNLSNRAARLKTALINKHRQLAGYAAIIYDNAGEATDAERMEACDALHAYKTLVRVEDCFEVLKSDLTLRPVFLQRNDTTAGHCLICVLALLLFRVIQYKMSQQSVVLSCAKIQAALNHARVALVPASTEVDDQEVFFMALENNDALYKRTQNQQRQSGGERKESGDTKDELLVMAAAGLDALPFCTNADGMIRYIRSDPRLPLLEQQHYDTIGAIKKFLSGGADVTLP